MTDAKPTLLAVEDLVTAFPNRSAGDGAPKMLRAVDGVSFTVRAGETFGLVGESGSGKTTLGKTLLRLYQPAEGAIRFDGVDITHLGDGAMRPHRRDLQMIFQDPLSSFNPRGRIGDAIALPIRLHKLKPAGEIDREVDRLLERVGLPVRFRDRFPHELSGGQLQRAAIARALALKPRLIVADEPVSKLDVSIRAQILNLFRDIQQESGVALIFITHDLRVARYLCDRVGVMFFGRMMEIGDTPDLFAHASHPYTRQLLGTLDAAARSEAAKEPAAPADPSGCRFRSRCPRADAICGKAPPPLVEASGRWIACHHPL